MTRSWPRLEADRSTTCLSYVVGVVCDGVNYVFDPRKDDANRVKHGVSLALAEVLFDGPYLVVLDDRFLYGEMRNVAYGLIAGRVFVCVYVDRAADRRVISLRKANQRERRRYGQRLEQSGH